MVDETITTATIVGVTCAILILLFLIQPLGTSKIGSAFAPIVIIWLLFNFCFGIYNLIQFDHSVLKALLTILRRGVFRQEQDGGLEITGRHPARLHWRGSLIRRPWCLRQEIDPAFLAMFRLSMPAPCVYWPNCIYQSKHWRVFESVLQLGTTRVVLP